MTRQRKLGRVARLVLVVLAVFAAGQIVAAIPKWTHQGGEGGGSSGSHHSNEVVRAVHRSS